MVFDDEFQAHLNKVNAAPFLFVGSGFSRRYTNSEDWEGLLKIFADLSGSPFERYASSANGNLPKAASLIAEDFHDVWWEDERFSAQRELYPSPSRRGSPLKIAVADHFDGLLDRLPTDGELAIELELLQKSVIEGVITTNYDGVLESLFPDFSVFAGQDELLFRDPQGVGEIYKIHGSSNNPESLVIDAEDYAEFRARNVYLAAKLLTTFVEHPVIFLGYSLSDENVREILTNIAAILTNDNIDKLQDRLIFVHWRPGIDQSTFARGQFVADGTSIPIWTAEVPNYREVFEVLGKLQRRLPAKVLRRLKEQVYELVQTSTPQGRVYVMDIDADVDFDEVDVVIGVGVESRIAKQGLVGLTRSDLQRDVLQGDIVSDSQSMVEVVNKVLPRHLSGATHTPICRYLRGAGYLSDAGDLVTGADVPDVVRERLRLGIGALRAPKQHVRGALERVKNADSFSRLVEDNRVLDVLFAIPHMAAEKVDIGELRQFLLDTEEEAKKGHALWKSQWGKCVCFYDYLANRTVEE